MAKPRFVSKTAAEIGDPQRCPQRPPDSAPPRRDYMTRFTGTG
jgi:hypothetical protein